MAHLDLPGNKFHLCDGPDESGVSFSLVTHTGHTDNDNLH